MPTGYTAKIGEDQSFEDFVLGCARAFGACIMQRDEPMDYKPMLQKPSDHHSSELIKAQAQLAEFLGMADDEKYDYGQMCAEEDIYRIKERIEKNRALRAKYESMLLKVQNWLPPSKDHVELKQFMISQITESIDFDCKNDYNYRELEKAKKTTPLEYYQQMLDSIVWNVEYHDKESVKEFDRTFERNNWITQLFESLDLKP